eukprot:CAMPEP_0114160892 /NCGR_PEP_ID=MMETSP0043_2-20121206/28620_1 /TAXON_ID=464988 /ORGANISM="Hemiselmis andersenii, Strain CCMP644" /LENGTH=97 /DNA_ID=CAMNT_0001257003 /DNA_START=71 /DNA_END=361 /DNA_ORIENTATION=+
MARKDKDGEAIDLVGEVMSLLKVDLNLEQSRYVADSLISESTEAVKVKVGETTGVAAAFAENLIQKNPVEHAEQAFKGGERAIQGVVEGGSQSLSKV